MRRDGPSATPLSRRNFLRLTGGASALALGLGAAGVARGATKVEETCESMDEIHVGDGSFKAINNDWSAQSASMCTYLYDDDTYGWQWDRGSTGEPDPNYPQALIGHKPWGTATSADQYPIQRKNVSSLEMELDVQINADKWDGEWNLTEEWWLMNQKPEQGVQKGDAITHEIMTVLEWSDAHNHGTPIHSSAFTDKYGNTFDYWAQYDIGWSFHIFRIQGNSAPSNVDFMPVVNYVSNNFGAYGDLWMTGMEVGNEYWDNTSGSTRVYEYDVSVNGAKSSSGQNVSSSDTTAPDAPSNLSSPSDTSSEVDLAWDASSSSDVAEYLVYVDGARDHTVGGSTTSTTVSSVSGGTCYDFHVTAVDDAGNESANSNTISIDPGSGSCGSDDGSTDDSTAPIADGWYYLQAKHSGKYVDVYAASTDDGASLIQWSFHGGENQQFYAEHLGDGVYKLTARHSGKAIDVYGGSTDDGADVIQWEYKGADNQHWTVEAVGDGSYAIRATHSGKALDVAAVSTDDGANVQQWSYGGGDNQEFYFESV